MLIARYKDARTATKFDTDDTQVNARDEALLPPALLKLFADLVLSALSQSELAAVPDD